MFKPFNTGKANKLNTMPLEVSCQLFLFPDVKWVTWLIRNNIFNKDRTTKNRLYLFNYHPHFHILSKTKQLPFIVYGGRFMLKEKHTADAKLRKNETPPWMLLLFCPTGNLGRIQINFMTKVNIFKNKLILETKFWLNLMALEHRSFGNIFASKTTRNYLGTVVAIFFGLKQLFLVPTSNFGAKMDAFVALEIHLRTTVSCSTSRK